MDRKRILFVDDEVAVLDALQNLLRKERKRWDMSFAVGGDQALAELQKGLFDVVVSDMRMPGMDGVQLLARVKKDYPGTARLALSGHADRESVLRALPVAHQFLSKPCEADVLRIAIERTCDLHRLLEDAGIRRVIGTLETLPSVPRTYVALTEAGSNPNTGIAEIARIIQSDPAMSVKVLQLVNSAYFGCQQRVVSIQKAVNYLGLELLKGLALTVQVFSSMGARPVGRFSLERLQRYSVVTARLAKRFVSDPAGAEEAFTAGLVGDVGKIVIAMGLPDEFAAVVEQTRATGRELHVVEREISGVTHAEVGAYLLGVWGLPFSIVESVAYHHRPSAVTEGPCGILAAVHAADALVDTSCCGEGPSTGAARLDLAFLERAGATPSLDAWKALAEAETSNMNRGA